VSAGSSGIIFDDLEEEKEEIYCA